MTITRQELAQGDTWTEHEEAVRRTSLAQHEQACNPRRDAVSIEERVA